MPECYIKHKADSKAAGDVILASDWNASHKIVGNVEPEMDNEYNLGSSTYRFKTVYATEVQVGDLILQGELSSWRITEREDGIYIINQSTNKVYKLKLEEV